MKLTRVAATTALIAGSLAQAGLAQVTALGAGEGELNIVAWPGYIERGETDKGFDWVTKFEEATGCKVNVKTANTSDEMVALMNEGGFDLVTASGDASLRLVAGKRVQPINTDLIPSWCEDRRAAEGRALVHRRRRALRRALPVGPERADVLDRGVQGAADLLVGGLRGADAARRPVEQGPGPGLRRPDPRRRRRAVPDGAQARARHRRTPTSSTRSSTPPRSTCCASSASWSGATGTTR